ncbi:Wzz/FepE/Etk N-terminal domain-containing protein [Alteromonas hispanica]|uniref:LPS O-antigen length regulator n=1 Tax=Alteromonas hispanica TaxID=315421 RepID=A0A6L9MY73_9ALTE|nr:Wzz/FepE/Etk N-terminal domain-containing protein [Alteromonas hispanica]NDW23199.1 LPS O-antigen length regulator [Alteromonas hispanica]
MNKTSSDVHRKDNSEFKSGVDLLEAINAIWDKKYSIIFITIFSTLLVLLYSLSLPKVYKSEVLLSPVTDSEGNGLNLLAGQLGGLATLAGVNLGTTSGNKATIALEILQSRSFISEFINSNNLKPQIMAAEGWDSERDELLFDNSVYIAEKQRWVRKSQSLKTEEPSDFEVYDKFIEQHLSVLQEKDTGLVKVAVTHFSPFFARSTVKKIVEALNDRIRTNDVQDAENSITYLKDALDSTGLADMKNVFYQLIEKQVQTMMLAKIRHEYAFKVIDPAVIPEKEEGPKILLICTVMGLLTFLLVVSYIVVKQSLSKILKH